MSLTFGPKIVCCFEKLENPGRAMRPHVDRLDYKMKLRKARPFKAQTASQAVRGVPSAELISDRHRQVVLNSVGRP